MESAEVKSTTQTTQQIPLPNASTILTLGIVSVVLCWCHGIVGLVLAIVALVLASKDMALYNSNPAAYTPHSYGNVKSGRNIAIIGLVLAGVFLFFLIIALLFLGLNFALFPWEFLKEFN
jgi:hypothetical protein